AGIVSVAVIIASFSSIAFIEFSFIASLDADEFEVAMALPGGTPLHATEREALQVEDILRSHPIVEDVVTRIGGQGSPEEASFTVAMFTERPEEVTAESVMNDLRGPLAAVPGIRFGGGDTGFGGGSDITVEVVARTAPALMSWAPRPTPVAEQMAAIPGLVDLDVSYKPGRPELQIQIDRQRADDLGLSTAQIASTVRLLVNGDVATTFRGEGTEADVRVQLAESDRGGMEDILNINLLSSNGQLVPLRNVAEIVEAVSPNAISRTDRQPTITINANVSAERTAPSATSDVAALLPTLELSEGTVVRMGGAAQDQTDAFTSMLSALLLGVLFVYMVLASQFGSFLQPLLIMLAMPLAIAGAIVGLLVAGFPLDLTAMIGFIMLMGLVVKNSVLLVDFANRARQKGATADEAMIIAGPVRLRPILMTSLAMILAMIPIAMGLSAGGEFRQPMAVAIMGGMITSTLLTLLVVPLAYGAVIGLQDRMSARRKAKQATQKAARQAARREQQPALESGAVAGGD
ncbi:MAG: efflux RND transporter permease subunit, partial [Caldilineaceae bacterium]|nr:efflux RND transporter permease subunit [Caldilineaceae bacterium]